MAKRNKTDFIVIHCSASQPTPSYGAKDIERIHRARGFKTIGYHYVIKTDGTVELGREDAEIGAHVEGWNAVSVGVCLVGGIDKRGNPANNFSAEQFASLKNLIVKLKDRFQGAIVQGHRDFPNVHKDCPCFSVKDWLKKEGI